MGTFSCLANCSICAMNALVIGSISALEANRWPRWNRKKLATPTARCNAGTYTFKYIRSIPSTSNVTCSLTTSATVCGKLIFGSGTTPILRDRLPLRRPKSLARIACSSPLSTGAIFSDYALCSDLAEIHLVGLRRSLVRFICVVTEDCHTALKCRAFSALTAKRADEPQAPAVPHQSAPQLSTSP